MQLRLDYHFPVIVLHYIVYPPSFSIFIGLPHWLITLSTPLSLLTSVLFLATMSLHVLYAPPTSVVGASGPHNLCFLPLHKCLRFCLWLTLCTLKDFIYLLTYLLTYLLFVTVTTLAHRDILCASQKCCYCHKWEGAPGFSSETFALYKSLAYFGWRDGLVVSVLDLRSLGHGFGSHWLRAVV